MNKLIFAALASTLFATNVVLAETPAAAPAAAGTCEAKAVSKEGKPLAGAAKAAFMKKCEKDSKGGDGKTEEAKTPAATPAPAAAAADTCEAKAVSKTGKPLAGGAKTAFMKKCEKDSKAGEAPAEKAPAKK